VRAIDYLKRNKGPLVPAEDVDRAVELHDACPDCHGAGGGFHPEQPCPGCGLNVFDSYGLERLPRKRKPQKPGNSPRRLGIWTTVVLAFALSGCCWTARRDCFPPCPPTQVVQVERPCELPPPVVIPPIQRVACETDLKLSCYAPAEAAKLARALAELKAWVKAARARCGEPTSAPASSPSR